MRPTARTLTLALLLCSAACVLALHALRTDVPPVSERLSAYALGPYGWLMTVAFVALGCGLASLGFTLLTERPRGTTWLVPTLGIAAGVGMVLSALYETEVSASSEIVHSRASIAATIAVVGLVVAHSLPAARRWSRVGADRTGIALAFAAVALLALAPVLHDTRWSGLGQRLLWAVLFAWLLRTLWRMP